MNICYLSRTFHRYRGGIESYTYQMAKALSALGHRIHIITRKGDEKFYLENMGKFVMIHKIDFSEEPFKGSWRLDKLMPFNELRYARAVATEISIIRKVYKLDIVETPGFTEGFLPALNKHVPFFQRLHGYHGLVEGHTNGTLRQGFRKRYIWNLERELSLKANGISSVSLEFAKRCQEIWGYQNKPVQIIFTGINLNQFKPDPLVKRERAVLFVGRLQESKGIGVLAQAIPEVLKSFPNINFLLAGRDSNESRPNPKQTWREHFAELFPSNVVFLGQLSTDELLNYYQSIAIAVFPSLYEPGGTVAEEAMAAGCATITANAGGFPEIIKDGHDGLIVPAKDPQSLAQAIIRLLENDQFRRTISENAVASAAKKFSLDRIVDQTISAYENAIDNFYLKARS